jgi:hypothetical protein
MEFEGNYRTQKSVAVRNVSHTHCSRLLANRTSVHDLSHIFTFFCTSPREWQVALSAYYLVSRQGFEFLKLTAALPSRNFRLMCNRLDIDQLPGADNLLNASLVLQDWRRLATGLVLQDWRRLATGLVLQDWRRLATGLVLQDCQKLATGLILQD